MYPDSGYKRTNAQSVCIRPFSRVGRGLGTRLGVYITMPNMSVLSELVYLHTLLSKRREFEYVVPVVMTTIMGQAVQCMLACFSQTKLT